MKRFTTRLSNSTPKTRLDDYLSEWLPTVVGKTISKTKMRALILSGAVYLNRHRNKIPSTEIYGGAVLEVYFDEKKLGLDGVVEAVPNLGLKTEQILFEDEWIILVNKNAGIPTQPTIDPNRPNLFDLTKKFLSQKYNKNENQIYLGLHHRLDRDTSGIVMFTKREEANKGVSLLFGEHRIQKTYHSLTWKMNDAKSYDLNERFEVKNFLGRISAKNQTSKFGSVKFNGDPAHTDFKILEKFKNAYWIEAMPKTGRTHQIRVHLSELGLPILGDQQYFPTNVIPLIKAPRLMLHAYQLEFDHPLQGNGMKIEAPLPDDFMKVLGTLKS